jgi:hypothetical protein
MSNQNITNTLNDMLVICSKNNLEFTLFREEGENYINYDIETKKININIFDYDDENLEKLVNEKYLELKKLFN